MSKIVFINRYFYPDHSATSQMLSDLAFALASRGERVHVLASRLIYDGSGSRLPSMQQINGVQVHRVLSSGLGRERHRYKFFDYFTFFLSASWKMLFVLKRGDTVVVKTDPPLMSVPMMVFSRLMGWRQVNWLQDAFPEVAMAAGVGSKTPRISSLVFALLTRLRNASLVKTSHTVVLGERMHDQIARSVGRPEWTANHLSIISNWADTKAIVPVAREANSLRAEWGLGRGLVVGYSGNMGVAHDFDVLLAAANQLKDTSDIQFLLIGGGKRKSSLEQGVASQALSNVHFQAYQPRETLHTSLTAADIHLITLRPAMEGLILPSKLYGIAAAGRPSIFLGDQDGEVARHLKKFDCGVTVRPGDADALVAAIRAYEADAELLARHGANARKMAVEHFDVAISVAKWQALLDGKCRM